MGRFRRLSAGWLFPAAVVLAACVAAWPALSQPGLVNTRGGGDSPFLLQRLHQLTAALADGHFPVRWMPDANYGYGYPFYNFYAPLSIYIAAVFRFLGFSFVRAIHLAQLAGFVTAGLGAFYLGRRWLGSAWAGLLAAVAYTVAPFHLVNVYVRGDSLAEFWAMAFYPLVLLAADGLLDATVTGGRRTADGRSQITERPSSVVRQLARPLALFALAYAALILSHNISALIFSPFLVLYLGLRLWVRGSGGAGERGSKERSPQPPRSPAPLLFTIAALVLALALAAWFFVPALAEQDLAQLGPVTEGYFHYSNHFRGLDLAQGALIFDYNPDGGRAFRLGLAQIGLALAGAAVLAWGSVGASVARDSYLVAAEQPPTNDHPPRHVHTAYLLIGAAVAVFMITPLSRPLWDHLPLLSFTQFPWRFLSVASLFLALLTGGLARLPGRPAAPLVAGTASLILLIGGLLGVRVDPLILTDADVTAERLAQYEWFTGNIGTTVSAEYLTPAAAPRPWTSAWLNLGQRDRAAGIEGDLRRATLTARAAARQTWQISAGPDGATVQLPTLYWPGWRATIDGRPAELQTRPASGLMELTLPEGEHAVALELGRTPARLAAELVSLVALLLTVGLLFIDGRPNRRRWAVGGLAVVVSLLIFGLIWRGENEALPRGDLTWDFAQMGYLHHTPGGVAFEDGARLYEYGYSADAVQAGETLTVTLSLAPGDGGAATLALVTPASARPAPEGAAEPPVLAAATAALDGETVTFSLPISDQTPPGLYAPRLTLDGTRPLLPSGGTRGELFLRPVRVATDDPQSSSLGQPATGLDVRALALTSRDATTLDGRFAWTTTRPLARRYQVSWRLQDGHGVALSQLDAQPGYGFQPTDAWPAPGPAYDWLALRLPEALSGPPPYTLVMLLYDVTTGEQLLLRRLGEMVDDSGRTIYRPMEPIFTPPENIHPLDVRFGEGETTLLRLLGYELEQTAESLRLTLHWQALDDIATDYTRFVHLIDAAGNVVAQADGRPVGNSYPTDQWLPGEVVGDAVALDLTAVPPGEYRLATGFYRPVEGLPRLTATGPEGPLPDGRALLPDTITVRP